MSPENSFNTYKWKLRNPKCFRSWGQILFDFSQAFCPAGSITLLTFCTELSIMSYVISESNFSQLVIEAVGSAALTIMIALNICCVGGPWRKSGSF